MKAILKRYRAFIITAAAIGIFTIINSQIGFKALGISAYSFKEMLLVKELLLEFDGYFKILKRKVDDFHVRKD